MRALRLSLLAASALLLEATPAWAQESDFNQASDWSVLLPNGGWFVLPILLCLGGTIWLIVTSTARMSRPRIGLLGHEETVRALFRQSDFAGADTFCREHPSSLTKILRAGIAVLGAGQQAVHDGVSAALATEELRFHTRFSYLKALAVCTPLLGLLGTIASLIGALLSYRPSGPDLAPALGAALVPSALGLLAGIVAAAAYFVLRERASAAILRLQEAVNHIFRRVSYDSLEGIEVGGHE